jgi:2-polyprenyl-6-methoxyphenol hydroxylase-like FAD-dependent oxidoreductase
MPQLRKVVVVGGGVGGLTCALALKQAGVEVEVHEKYPDLPRRATGFTLWSYAIRYLERLGLEDPGRFGSPIEVTEIRNQEGDLIESMPVGEVSRKLGSPSCEVNRRAFQQVAIETLGEGVVRMGSECVGVEDKGEAGAAAVLANGDRAAGDLLIGADGIHSTVRKSVARSPRLVYSGFSTWGGVLEHFRHDLLSANHHVEIWARGSKGGVADIGGENARWYVTHRAPAGAGSAPIRKREVLEHIDGWYELLVAAVEAADESTIVATEAWDLDPLESWVSRRVVLLGDSAHATTPFAAMGACMTIEDSVTLMRYLASDSSLRDALLGFEHERKQRDEAVVRRSRRMAELSQMHSPLATWLRDEAFSHMPEDKVRRVAEEMARGE